MTIFHCSYIQREKNRAAAIPCSRNAITIWRDKDGVGHGWCSDHLKEGHLEAQRRGWLVSQSALESVA